MDSKRVAEYTTDGTRTHKRVRTMHQIRSGDNWEWPVMQQNCQFMMPFWAYNCAHEQQQLDSAAAPAASRGTRDTLSLGNWAKRQVSLELSLGQGPNNARSPCRSAEDSDVEDTATSSCSESSGGPARHQHDDRACALQQGAAHQQAAATTGEDDSINSHQSGNASSPAFCFGCIPHVATDLQSIWPAVEVQAK